MMKSDNGKEWAKDMTYEALLKQALEMDSRFEEKNMMLPNARIIAFLMDNCEIIIPEKSYFFVETNLKGFGNRILRKVLDARTDALPKYRTEANKQAIDSRAYYGSQDFGHTAPDWEVIFSLGLEGLKQRVLARTGSPQNPHFVEATILVLEAAQRFVLRCAAAAEQAGRTQMAEGLKHLSAGTPRNLYEAFQLTLLYYSLQQYFEAVDVRTMGRLDQLTMPFAAKEGKEQVQLLADRYIREIDAIEATANMPFALGGGDENGKSMVNPMSYVLLEAYKKTKLPNVKLHILCTPDIPEDFLLSCMESIKDGGNSLVFINDPVMVRGLEKLGIEREDARRYSIVGCYEASAREEIPCSCSTRVNLVKALEYTLHAGKDMLTGYQVGLAVEPEFETFEALYEAFWNNTKYLADSAMLLTNTAEARNPMRYAAPLYSATLTECVLRGGDAYSNNAARYSNSSLMAIGLGTVADSLCAIRTLVYEKKMLTLHQLIRVLDGNWEGQEPLRSFVRNKLPKYGNGDPQVDALAVDIANRLSGAVNGMPNGRGGLYRLGIFSIDWRAVWGKHTGASADGRRTGDSLSQNASATFGMDREGPVGHILSVTALPGEDAVNGLVLDMEMHSSAVSGSNGTRVLLATLKTFLQKGGQTIHYNILDTETLKDAQLYPENHRNLQVRVCGWNAEFTKMTRAEQDEYILRSQMQMR